MVKITSKNKECSKPLCRRIARGKFKTCERCRASSRKAMKKIRVLKTCNGNEKQCKCCGKVQKTDQFVSSHVRRKKLTARCLTCRSSAKRSQVNPTTTTGKCKAIWEDWKATHECLSCGCTDARLIEADHQRNKVRRCSEYFYWACNGGIEALKKELTKCVPLCRVCHRVKTKNERGTTTRQSRLAKRKIIDDEKLRRGACLVCKRQVSKESTCAFDFDHIDPSRKIINIAQFIFKSWSHFNENFHTEAQKCNLLCANCHHLKTHY